MALSSIPHEPVANPRAGSNGLVVDHGNHAAASDPARTRPGPFDRAVSQAQAANAGALALIAVLTVAILVRAYAVTILEP